MDLLEEIIPNGSTHRILDLFNRDVLGSLPRNGATLVFPSGEIVRQEEPEGIRTTHVGCASNLRSALEGTLISIQRPYHRFIDALILASKVLSSGSVLLEICASDDPEYTTGYIASPTFGYIRIPHMKSGGIRRGGRLYIVDPDSNLHDLLYFLRWVPVLFTSQDNEESVRGHPLLTKIPSVITTGPRDSTNGSSL